MEVYTHGLTIHEEQTEMTLAVFSKSGHNIVSQVMCSSKGGSLFGSFKSRWVLCLPKGM